MPSILLVKVRDEFPLLLCSTAVILCKVKTPKGKRNQCGLELVFSNSRSPQSAGNSVPLNHLHSFSTQNMQQEKQAKAHKQNCSTTPWQMRYPICHHHFFMERRKKHLSTPGSLLKARFNSPQIWEEKCKENVPHCTLTALITTLKEKK